MCPQSTIGSALGDWAVAVKMRPRRSLMASVKAAGRLPPTGTHPQGELLLGQREFRPSLANETTQGLAGSGDREEGRRLPFPDESNPRPNHAARVVFDVECPHQGRDG